MSVKSNPPRKTLIKANFDLTSLKFEKYVYPKDCEQLDEAYNYGPPATVQKELECFKRQGNGINPEEIKVSLTDEQLKRAGQLMCQLVNAYNQLSGTSVELEVCGTIEPFISQFTRIWFENESSSSPETQEECLTIASRLISKDRNDQYGKAEINLGETGKIWEIILGADNITAAKVALCMVALKLVREKYKHKSDSCIDGAAYFALADDLANRGF